ncbi:hypothetical protein HRI_000235800 [Hibiscus trionum]|uniref:Uncharacterized protein n=1 Tax=Hibiscus trionum TaxID=183268 RepID=A0A9W7GXF5_HIBTR|nr:hypothetical protein HRI_000235800 [Hibiscus trionum]
MGPESSSATSLSSTTLSLSGKRYRDPEDEVYVDNPYSHKRYHSVETTSGDLSRHSFLHLFISTGNERTKRERTIQREKRELKTELLE